MGIPILNDIVIIFGLAVVVLFVCSRLRIPTIVGFFLTGMLAGPHGLGLIKVVHEVEILAEIGVVLLLFAIGIEFSLKGLLQIKKSFLLGGSLQVWLTFLATFFIAMKLGQSFSESIFLGFLISLSSTAIVLKLIQERAEVDSPHGSVTLGVLIYQDVIIVPMMLFTPLLVGATDNFGESPLILVTKGIAIILLLIVSTKWIVPQLLHQIARTRNRELFLLSVLVICLGFAWIFFSVGLSLALGAFLAGLVISESEYAHQSLGNVLYFRDIFISFFFVSIGMLLDVNFFLQQPGLIVLIALGVLVLKTIIAGFTTVLLGFPIRTAILVGLSLNQVGEFSFILSKTGLKHGFLAGNIYQLFLSISVMTMAVTPFIIALAPRIADFVSSLPMPKRLKSGLYPVRETKRVSRKDHIIIIGFGVNGRNLARVARVTDIPYVIIEMNPETVRDEKTKGEPIYYGDATHEAVLQHVDLKDARVAVVAISDPVATRRIAVLIQRLNPMVWTIVRTRYVQEMKTLYELGANEVIPEEFETSIEIFSRVLKKYLMPRDEIDKHIAKIRSEGYEMFRSLSREPASLSDLKLHLTDIEIVTFRVSEKSSLIGKTLSHIDLRKKYGVTLLAIRRKSQMLSNPGGDMQLCANDVIIILGAPDKIAKITGLLNNPENK